MMRRRIAIGGVSLTSLHQRHAEVKERMREKFRDDAYVNKFIDILIRSGWDSLDIESAVRQHENTQRPAVQAFLFHNEHVLDQIRLNQGTYTHFRDTASDPNYALRHPGQTELLIRRLTPGDLAMLSAAQYVSARLGDDDRPSEQIDNYWQRVWTQILSQMPMIAPQIAAHYLHQEPLAAVSAALDYVMLTNEPEDGEPVSLEDIRTTFMDPRKPFYVGINVSQERVRGDNGFETRWCFNHVEDRWESCWMAACVLFCYAMDNDARNVMNGERSLPKNAHFYDRFITLLTYNRLSKFYMPEASHADQETQHNTGPVHTSRLLP